MHIDPGQVGGPATQHRVQVRGARRGILRPRGFVPTVTPDRLAGVGGRIVADQPQAMPTRRRGPQIEPGQRQTRGGEVDVAVDKARRDEATVEIDQLGTLELASTNVVAAQPHHDTVADRHRGRVGMGRAVNPAVDQQRCGHLRHAANLRGGDGSTRARPATMRAVHRAEEEPGNQTAAARPAGRPP